MSILVRSLPNKKMNKKDLTIKEVFNKAFENHNKKNLSFNYINSLPDGICNLINLEWLLLTGNYLFLY